MDRNLEYCRDRYQVPNLVHDYREVIGDSSIQAVHICLPNSLHYPACKEALGTGQARPSGEAHHVDERRRARTGGARRGEEPHLVRGSHLPLQQRPRRGEAALENNFFGRVFLLNLTWTNLEPVFSDRDVIVDLAPHYFDIVNYLFEAWPQRITCVAKPYRQKAQEEAAYIISEMPSGAVSRPTSTGYHRRRCARSRWWARTVPAP